MEHVMSETEREVERLKGLERDTLMQWAEIADLAKNDEIDLENLLDPREDDPSYKAIKIRLLALKDETLKLLFELDNKMEVYRRKGIIIES